MSSPASSPVSAAPAQPAPAAAPAPTGSFFGRIVKTISGSRIADLFRSLFNCFRFYTNNRFEKADGNQIGPSTEMKNHSNSPSERIKAIDDELEQLQKRKDARINTHGSAPY